MTEHAAALREAQRVIARLKRSRHPHATLAAALLRARSAQVDVDAARIVELNARLANELLPPADTLGAQLDELRLRMTP